ncbi:MAG TPA: spermidine/putrescine ABC transporter permease [Oceanospirillaceae bacterium]|nr:spermidine/putrescine ABC transporter permease [Oceanospirillaceae bacterium]
MAKLTPNIPSKTRFNLDVYALTWRLPVIIWQLVFFIAPLLFMIAMSFFLVKNYRMVEAFEFVNWAKMFSKGYFWNSYGLSIGLALMATFCATVIAFPAAYALAYKVSETTRRWAIFFLIIPFFTSYLVRTFSWYVLLAESGIVNELLSYIGLGPFTMLNTTFGTLVGYLTLTLPLVIILQTLSMANIDKNLIEAAHNLGANTARTIIEVIIPAAKVGLIVGALFCFILSFGDFVSPYYLGGSKPPTLSILIIDTTKSGQQWPRAAVIAVTMMVTLMVVAFTAIKLAYGKKVKS